MEVTVYTLEDFRPDYEHGVIGVYDSFEKAKERLIDELKMSIKLCEDELEIGEDEFDEYDKELLDYIAELKEEIKIVQKAIPSPYYSCDQLYITEHTLN